MDFRVGPWLVQPGLGSLVGAGRTSHVTPKAMDVLLCLARRQGQVVSKEEVRRDVWPDTFVSDDALTRCIGELRRAFHDDAGKPSIIETIAKRGYRILAPVKWDEVSSGPGVQTPAVDSPVWKRRSILAGGGLLLLLAVLLTPVLRRGWPIRNGTTAIRTIAVLPLANLSGNPEQEYFADGMTEALITRLAQVSTLRVISRTSVMRYKGTRKPLPEIAREMAVDGVVEGTVLRSGSRVRITAQLIRAATDLHLWSGSFEREESDVLSLQADIAQAIVAEVRTALTPEEHARLSRARQVVPEAYAAYLKGWYLFNRSQFAEAASYFEQATAADPGFAVAYAMLTEADTMVTYNQDRPPSDRALKALARARELDDTLAEVHTDIADIKISVVGIGEGAKWSTVARSSSIVARWMPRCTTRCASMSWHAGTRRSPNIGALYSWIPPPPV